MKHFIGLLLLLHLPFSARTQFAYSQPIAEDTCLTYQPIEGIPYIFIPSYFGRDQLFQDRLSDSLKNKTILKIDLTYTLFKTDKNFDQAKLNRLRWQGLQHRFSLLFDNTATTLGNVCQSLSTTAEEAKLQHHGFFVYYRNNTDSLAREKEIDEVENYLLQLEKQDTKNKVKKTDTLDRYTEVARVKKNRRYPPPKPKRKLKDRKACREPFYKNGDEDLAAHFTKNTTYTFRKRKKESAEVVIALKQDGEIGLLSFNHFSKDKFKKAITESILLMEDWHGAYYKGRALKSVVRLKITASARHGYQVEKFLVDPQKTIVCGEVSDDSIFFPLPANQPQTFFPDQLNNMQHLLFEVLERNAPLRNTLFVIDVTGSMSGYIVGALEVFNDSLVSQKANVKSVVVFNDGDNRNDFGKRAGHTGGIYQTDEVEVKSLARFVVKAMRKGNGGDCPENNIEALLEGLRGCNSCSDIVMVADNYATPRDMALIQQVKWPAHWILCGTDWGVNPAYLDLIRSNKGYGHTANSDFKDLHLLKEGDTIEVEDLVYELKNNKFVRKDQ